MPGADLGEHVDLLTPLLRTQVIEARLPLGYDLVAKRLVVNAEEAERVRAIFALYLRIGALLPTAHELNARGWTSKS